MHRLASYGVVLAMVTAIVLIVTSCKKEKAPRKKHRSIPGQVSPHARYRQTLIAELPPGPLPNSTALLGSKGVDEYGYPRQYVDRRGLQSLLWHKKYQLLNMARARSAPSSSA